VSERAAALDHVPAGWESLLAADPSASPSHRPEVWSAAAAAIPGFEWRLLAFESGGRLVSGVPLVLSRRGPFRWLHALPWVLPAPPLAAPGEHASADLVLAGAFAAYARELGVVGGEWSFYRPEGPAPDEACLARVPGETRWFEAALLRLSDGLDGLRARTSRKQRHALEQAREHGYVFAEEPESLDEAHALHLTQARAWRGHRPLPIELSRQLLAAGGPEPAARLFTLRSRRGLVSATLALDSPAETFVWWSGTHPEGRRTHAFPLLMWSVAEWAASRGRRRLNLGASDRLPHVEAFKEALGAEAFRYPVRWLDSSAAGWLGRALERLQRRIRRGRPRGTAP
jgi:hypothetical protein